MPPPRPVKMPALIQFSPAMPDQDLTSAQYFLPAQEAGGLARIPNGVELTLDQGENRLRVEVLRGDILRLKISRVGQFDEQPTLAVVDGARGRWAAAGNFAWRTRPGRVRVSTAELTLTIGKSPFRLDAHRADGSAIFESAADPRCLRHVQRRVPARPTMPAGGCLLRAGREGRPLQPRGQRLHALEHGRAQPDRGRRGQGQIQRGRSARRSAQHGIRSLLCIDPVLLSPAPSASCDGGLLHRQSLPRPLRFRGATRPSPSASSAGSTPSTFSPVRACPASSPLTPR